ncbi:prealbumin-like fold domain-containing protein [Lactobacillus delbrueckii]|uniref:prealbumin-like fold domain-containing protein n=1 Tax=Lactobacillus delbrueckii TaxID=1584 RepID=UPI0022E39308|nr:prealbumin-like fold domain-containing protein [Lactobacillus delbrueckii]
MMRIMKKSRAFLLAAVLILQLILLPLAEVGRASASEVSDQLVFMQGQKELTGKDKNESLNLKLGGQETLTLKRTKDEADLEVKISLPDLVDLDKTATDKANKELKIDKAEEAVKEVAASEKEGRHLLLHFAKGQSQLKFTLTGKEVASGQLIATYQEDSKEYSSYPLLVKVENEETEESSSSSASTSSTSSSPAASNSSVSTSSSTSSEEKQSSQTQSSSSQSSAEESSKSSVSTASSSVSSAKTSSSSESSSEKASSAQTSSSSSEKAASASSSNTLTTNLTRSRAIFNAVNAQLLATSQLATTPATTKANSDLTVVADSSPSTVWSGSSALFTVNFKVSGSRYDEADHWPATLTFSLKDTADSHLALKTDVLPEVAGIKPTVTDGKIVYTFQKSDLKAGQTYTFKLAVKTDNGYINDGTPAELIGDFKDNTGYEVKASDTKKISTNTSVSISTTFLGAKNGSPNTAPGTRDVLAWRISLSVPNKTGLNFLDPTQKLQVSYKLGKGVYDSFSDSDGDLTYVGTDSNTVTWELPTPSIAEQAASLANGQPLVQKSFIVYTKPGTRWLSSWGNNASITNFATLTGKNLQGTNLSVTDEATGQIGKVITGTVNPNGTVLYPNFYGPKDGDGNMAKQPLTTVYDTASLLYANQIFSGTDLSTTTEQYNSSGRFVKNIAPDTFDSTIIKSFRDVGLQKSVVHYEIDPHIIIKTLEISTPWLQLYTGVPSSNYPDGTGPGTLVTLYVKNTETGSLRTVTKYVTKTGQLPLSYYGVNSNERLVSADFSIQYEDSSQLIDARTAGAVFLRGGVEEGFVGQATVTTQFYVVTEDGTKYVHYSTTNKTTADGNFSPIGPRTIDVIAKPSSTPIGRTDVSFAQHAKDGETVIQKNASNRVIADFYNVTNSPISTKSPTVLSVLLPKGVTVDSANTDVKMYLVNDRTGQETLLERGTSAGNWSGAYTYKQTLKNKDSVDTGQQYVKFVMGEGQGGLQPGYHLRGEINVNVGDVSGSVTLKSYGASYSQKLLAPTGYSLIKDKGSDNVSDGEAYREVADLFGDGNLKVAVASQQSYSLSSYDMLKTEKEVKGDLDSSYSSMAHASLGGRISYRLKFSNTDGQAITKLTLLDVLPTVGDLGITDNVDRESKFTPVLTGPITLNNSNLEIKYSTSSKPSRQLLNNSVTNWPAGAQKLKDPSGAENPTWLTQDQVTDWSKIRSFTITLKSGQTIKAGQSTTIEFTMQAPKRTDLTASQLQTLLNPSTAESSRAAWNSFAVTTNNLLTVEPARVGVVLEDASATIIKKDAVSGKTLSGVEFKLADSEANAKAGKFLRLVDGKVVAPSDSGYSSGQDYALKSDSNGQLLFTGLKEGQTYYAVETKALDGYQLDATPHAVKASYQTSQAAITVYNQKQPVLPQTGGPGSLIFILLGLILLLLAVLGLRNHRIIKQ